MTGGDGSGVPHSSARQLSDALRAGHCPSDAAFDRFLPPALRTVSQEYWTPLRVVRRAAQWLTRHELRSVVDVGSGVGKFCVGTAAALAGSRCIGVEHRRALVLTARALARRFEVQDQVSFVEGSFGEMAAIEADAYYLYNPFGENLVAAEDALDQETERSAERYQRDIEVVRQRFATARVGTCVLTYNGFGGQMPGTYECVELDRELPYELCMWKKVRDPAL